MKGHIYVVDDEAGICLALQEFLLELGYSVSVSATAEDALSRCVSTPPEVIVMDIHLPGLSGIEAIQKFQALLPNVSIILMTAYGTIQTAVEAMKSGVFEYLTKPVDLEKIGQLIQQSLHTRQFTLESKTSPKESLGKLALIGQSLAMQQVFKQVAYAVSSVANVLIQGESGTGKELIARAIHEYGPRQSGPYSIVNCATLTESIFESELYGHEIGSYTGANRLKIGKVEISEGGTLFLDEIAEIPLSHQAKLLRFLETKTFERIGSNTSRVVDTRIICATNQDLQQRVQLGTFRTDLFYRLNALVIPLPPLRERRDDIPLLLQYFLSQSQKKETSFALETVQLMQQYSWPGNIRELKNVVEQASLLSRNRLILPVHLPSVFFLEKTKNTTTSQEEIDQIVKKIYQDPEQNPNTLFEQIIGHFEASLLRQVLDEYKHNQTLVSRKLGLHRTTLRNKIKLYKL
ncbi:MAG: sigma-54 dependent transcriptional regulator [Planctomycetota bacterium]